jgi:hypothetical protein
MTASLLKKRAGHKYPDALSLVGKGELIWISILKEYQ